MISTEFCLDHSTEIRLDALMDRLMEFHDNQLEVRNIFANKGLIRRQLGGITHLDFIGNRYINQLERFSVNGG